MERRTLDPTDSLRLLNGGPEVLVTTRWRTQSDVSPHPAHPEVLEGRAPRFAVAPALHSRSRLPVT